MALGPSPVTDLLEALPACTSRSLTVPLDEISAGIDAVSLAATACSGFARAGRALNSIRSTMPCTASDTSHACCLLSVCRCS